MLFVAYCTQGTPYETVEAVQLQANLMRMGISHKIAIIPNLGSWQKNTQFKSRFVAEMCKEIDGPFTYVDVDAEVLSEPVFLDELATRKTVAGVPAVDIAACRFKGQELLSGTVYFGNTPKCRQVVMQWIKFCEQYPERFPAGFLTRYPQGERAWDQRLLDKAIQVVQACGGVNFVELPQEYCYIHDLTRKAYPDIKPVIQHLTASRLYKSVINKGAKATGHCQRTET